MISRRSLRWLGVAITMLSLALLARGLVASGREVAGQVSDPRVLALAVALSLVYAALLCLPALGWARVLDRDGARPGAAFTAMGIYARCNVLKYLPGNVFHFGGRQFLARQAGWEHRDILLASLIETASLPLAAIWVALALLAVPIVMGGGFGADFVRTLAAGIDPRLLALAVSAVAGVTAVACILAFRRGVRGVSLAAMAALSTGFFAANAGLVLALASALSPELSPAGPAELAVLAAAYLAGWVIGFLVPGAPGGIGVREALFVQLAAVAVSAPTALTLAILTRLVTSLGDLWFALAALVSTPSGAASGAGGRGE